MGGPGGGSGWGGQVWGGQGGCERRIKVLVKIQKKKNWGVGGVRSGGGRGVRSRGGRVGLGGSG